MPITQLERTTSFSVDIIDGNGVEVPWEPVTARFILGGDTREVRAVTDTQGRARIETATDLWPDAVEILAAGETTGTIRPEQGARFVIEI